MPSCPPCALFGGSSSAVNRCSLRRKGSSSPVLGDSLSLRSLGYFQMADNGTIKLLHHVLFTSISRFHDHLSEHHSGYQKRKIMVMYRRLLRIHTAVRLSNSCPSKWCVPFSLHCAEFAVEEYCSILPVLRMHPTSGPTLYSLVTDCFLLG